MSLQQISKTNARTCGSIFLRETRRTTSDIGRFMRSKRDWTKNIGRNNNMVGYMSRLDHAGETIKNQSQYENNTMKAIESGGFSSPASVLISRSILQVMKLESWFCPSWKRNAQRNTSCMISACDILSRIPCEFWKKYPWLLRNRILLAGTLKVFKKILKVSKEMHVKKRIQNLLTQDVF